MRSLDEPTAAEGYTTFDLRFRAFAPYARRSGPLPVHTSALQISPSGLDLAVESTLTDHKLGSFPWRKVNCEVAKLIFAGDFGYNVIDLIDEVLGLFLAKLIFKNHQLVQVAFSFPIFSVG